MSRTIGSCPECGRDVEVRDGLAEESGMYGDGETQFIDCDKCGERLLWSAHASIEWELELAEDL